MIPEEVAAVIIVNEYPLRMVWSATSLLKSEVVTVHAIKVCEGRAPLILKFSPRWR
jgi:hypothetical protein